MIQRESTNRALIRSFNSSRMHNLCSLSVALIHARKTFFKKVALKYTQSFPIYMYFLPACFRYVRHLEWLFLSRARNFFLNLSLSLVSFIFLLFARHAASSRSVVGFLPLRTYWIEAFCALGFTAIRRSHIRCWGTVWVRSTHRRVTVDGEDVVGRPANGAALSFRTTLFKRQYAFEIFITLYGSTRGFLRQMHVQEGAARGLMHLLRLRAGGD